MEDNIDWSTETYTVEDLILNRGQFPMLIKLAGDEEEDPYDGEVRPDPRPGKIYRLKECGSHLRAICVTEGNSTDMFSIPLNYPIKFAEIGPTGSNKPGVYRCLSDIIKAKQNTFPFHIVMESDPRHEFKVGTDSMIKNCLELGTLTVIDIISERFIKANTIQNGFLGKSVVVLRQGLTCLFNVAEGFTHERKLTYTWDDLFDALKTITLTIDYSRAMPIYDLLKYSEPLYICEHTRRKPPSLENSEENQKLYQALQQTIFATLRRSRNSGEACIAKTIKSQATKNDEIYGTCGGGPPSTSRGVSGCGRMSKRRGSESSVVYLPQGADARKGSVRKKIALLRSRDSLLREPSRAKPSTCCPDCVATGEIYVCMHGFKRDTRPASLPAGDDKENQSVYEEIDPLKMDSRISDLVRNKTSMGSDDRHSAPPIPPQRGSGDSYSHLVSGPPKDDTYLNPLPSTSFQERGGTTLTEDVPPPPPCVSASQRPRSISLIQSVKDIPEDITKLTRADVIRCLELLNLEKYKDAFIKEQVDGISLVNDYGVDDFKNTMKMEGPHAKRLHRFANDNWRPAEL